jgi:hypothetical protein
MTSLPFEETASKTVTLGGRLRRALKRMTAVREERPRRRVGDYLFLMDDARLATFALDRKNSAAGFRAGFPW